MTKKMFFDELHAERNKLLKIFHFNIVMKKAVKSALLKGNETVLDYGCGTRVLKKFLPRGVKYIGYDIAPQRSDVKTPYQAIPVDVIFALSVLEHMQVNEINQFLEFVEKSKAKRLVISLPADNLFNNFLKFLYGNNVTTFFHHITSSQEIVKLINAKFGVPESFCQVHRIKYIGTYRVR